MAPAPRSSASSEVPRRYGKAIGADDKRGPAALEAGPQGIADRGLDAAPCTVDRAGRGRPVHPVRRGGGPARARKKRIAQPHTTCSRACAANVAPFRPELVDVLAGLAKKRINIGFIRFGQRRDHDPHSRDLLTRRAEVARPRPDHRQRREVRDPRAAVRAGGAGRRAGAARRASRRCHRRVAASTVNRPLYLRRGAYFEALCALYHAFGDDSFPIEKTLVCGDIWELDLAMPAVLGAQVHLIERAAPYATYPLRAGGDGEPEARQREPQGPAEAGCRQRSGTLSGMVDDSGDDDPASVVTRPDTDARTVAARVAPRGDVTLTDPSPRPDEPATSRSGLPEVDASHYEIGGEIAHGGMGRIRQARDLRLGRDVAIKELLCWGAHRGARFEREALLTARLQHPRDRPGLRGRALAVRRAVLRDESSCRGDRSSRSSPRPRGSTPGSRCCRTRSRSPTRWRARTTRGSSTAISSPRTCSSGATARRS